MGNALEEQKNHLKEEFNFDLKTTGLNVDEMNKMAIAAKNFTDGMAEFLRNGTKFSDEKVKGWVQNHLHFLNKNGHPTTKEDYLNQATFFLQDDFHRELLEKQQIGLAYYLLAVAENL